MTDVAHKVLAGFVRLSSSDQHDVIEAINRFKAGAPAERSRLRREYEDAVMGPVSSNCPCCAAAQKRPHSHNLAIPSLGNSSVATRPTRLDLLLKAARLHEQSARPHRG